MTPAAYDEGPGNAARQAMRDAHAAVLAAERARR